MDSTSIKALRALEWMCLRDSPTGVTEMAITLGMGKSNAHRVLSTLATMGYVRALEDGRYSPTLKTWELGCALIERLDFKFLARPVMEQLSEDTMETVHLSILDRLDVVYVDKVESNQPVRAYSRIGGRAPAYAVATGKVLLAYQKGLPESLPKTLPKHSEMTIADRQSLLDELEDIRQRGYAINRGEWRESVCGVASPIRNDRGEVIAAIGISGPASRLGLPKLQLLGPKVIESAEKVSAELGYRQHRARAPVIGIEVTTLPKAAPRARAVRKTAAKKAK
ncbi:IclR family transcriptional regulator [Castellaniella sp. GW247-6E4]|uniref:IclR family transcriptional regulator n=1 Tax=Castellaniella sp. GW247-6E4 TaxID=3140380 RepID=UPI00331574E0